MRLLVALALLCPLAAAAAPEDPGPESTTSEVQSIQAGPSIVSALVCEPTPLPGNSPILVLGTTASESTNVLQALCLQYASYGFVVAAPALGFANTQAPSIGATLTDTLAFFVSENARAASRYYGKLDVAHRGVVGFGTGAMGAMQAAVTDDTLSVAIVLDPYDLNGQARALAAQIVHVPVMMVRADPNVCNGEDSFGTVYAAMTGPASTVHVYDSNACDVESPEATDCQVCGTQRPYAAARFLRYATAYANYFVACQPAMRSYVDGAGLQADLTDASLDENSAQDLPTGCGPYVVPDAGPPDAGPVATPATGCSCGARSPGDSGSSGAMVAWALGAAAAARRLGRRRIP